MIGLKQSIFSIELLNKLTQLELKYLLKHYTPKSEGFDRKNIDGTAEELIQRHKDYIF